MEEYYISNGYILPQYHKQYWMGLNSSANIFPNFTWLTPDVDSAVYLADYSHWGTSQPLNDETKMCAGGNFNKSYDEAWGWANDECTLPYIFMCRIMRELPGSLPPALGSQVPARWHSRAAAAPRAAVWQQLLAKKAGARLTKPPGRLQRRASSRTPPTSPVPPTP